MAKGGMFKISNRRGMSPLIATVLLMAFAVALGAFIMNITIDNKSEGVCDSIQVTVHQFCQGSDGVHLALTNDKTSVLIKEFNVVYAQGSIENTLKIRDSALGPGDLLQEVVIPVTVTNGTMVNIMAVIGSAEAPIACQKPVASVPTLPACS